jgi:hypothetical protein
VHKQFVCVRPCNRLLTKQRAIAIVVSEPDYNPRLIATGFYGTGFFAIIVSWVRKFSTKSEK